MLLVDNVLANIEKDVINPFDYHIFPVGDEIELIDLINKIKRKYHYLSFYPIIEYTNDIHDNYNLANVNKISKCLIVDPGSLDDNMVTLFDSESGLQNRTEIENIK